MERPGRGDPVPGSTIGPFSVTGLLGAGARGSVLEVRDGGGPPLALKLLHGTIDATSAARFEREARVLASLDHPNIVKFVGVGVASARAWLAMELVQGTSLDPMLARGAMTPAAARDVARQVALALAHAHSRGVVHRDLKPANVLVEAGTGRVVVVDFGVARVLEESRLTRTGEWLGTPLYMAPEQLGGATGAGPAADVWGLGATLYHLLTGRPPFEEEGGLVALATRIASTEVVAPSALRGGIPPDLEAACLRCLQRDPKTRPSGSEVAGALAAPRGRRRRERPRGAWPALVASAATGLGLIVWLALRPTSPAASSTVEAPREAPTARPAWSLDAGPPARQAAPLLWDEGGRRVEPLRGARTGEAEALEAVFLGGAVRLDDGRVRVRYDDLGVALGAVWERPGNAIEAQSAVLPGVKRADDADAWIVVAPDDSGEVVFRIGRARWRGGAVDVEVVARPVPHLVDTARVLLMIGPSPPRPDVIPARVTLEGRQRTAHLVTAAGRYGGIGDDLREWTKLRLAPGGPAGTRAVVGEPMGLDADGLAAAPAPDGVASLGVGEHRISVRRLQVSGRPLSADVPALAWTPVPLQRGATLTAAFEVVDDEASAGGPCLALGDERAGRYLLEVAGDALLLWSGSRLLDRCALPGRGTRGELRLERDADHLQGALTTADGVWRVDAWDPLPLDARDHRGGFGSSGPAVRFSLVTASSAEDDPGRAATDAGQTSGSAGDATARWRAAALALARLFHPAWLDSSHVGAQGGARRRELAAVAAAELEAVAPALRAGASADARARATFAWVLAGRADRAQSAAGSLVEAVGPAAALAAVDRLLMIHDEPALVRILALGWIAAERVPEVRTAAAQVVRCLPAPPGLRSLALEVLAAHATDASATVALLREALPQSLVPDATRLGLAEALLKLEQAAEAAALLDEVRELGWYGWRLRLDAALQRGRGDEAIEAAIAVAALRQRAESMRLVEAVLGRVKGIAGPAHVALALAVLADATPARADSDDLRRQALAAADLVVDGAAPRSHDLARYARALATGYRVEEVAAPGGGQERPTQVLLRARFGGAGAEQLTDARLADPLVLHLTLLDRAFSGSTGR